ncbi:lipopolysaccharide assembly LapA domain-containing protein [Sulfurivirga sp.]|uniref:LapA family protein n=1 Tax=Sulfurivirga sp. TaxID=2614236 RepID=UPI0025FA1174|nr:LapA family protein [Sulfurivirga sp.]
MGRLIQWILLGLFAAAGVVMGVLNPQAVPFNFPGGQVQWPLSVLLALAFAAGMIVMLFYSMAQWLAWRLARRSLRRKLDACEAEKLELKRHKVEKALPSNTLPDKPHG